MICKVCGSDFNIENFDMCPYCLTPVEHVDLNYIGESAPDMVEAEAIEKEVLEVPKSYECISEESQIEIDEDYEVTEADLLEDESEESQEEIGIDEIGLSVRAVNAFRRGGIHTLSELIDFLAVNSVSDLKNVGAKTVKETEELMEKVRSGELSPFRERIEGETTISVSPLFENISVDVDYLSCYALTELGLTNKAVDLLIKSGIRCCGELRTLYRKDFINILGPRYIDRLPNVACLLENDIISLLGYVLDNSRSSREYEVFLRRAQGETLQEIASKPMNDNDGVITRERVRQIERSYLKSIKHLVRELLFILKGGDSFVSVDDLLEVFDDDEYDQVLLYACKAFDEFEYLDFADIFVERRDSESIEDKVTNLVTEIVEDGIDLNEDRDVIEGILIENKYDYISIESIKRLLIKNHYYAYGSFLVKGRTNYATICMYIIRKYFQDGIKLSQSDYEQSEDLIKLRQIVNDRYPGIVVPSSDRTISSTLVRSGLILRGRGYYISQEHIHIDETLLAEIKDYIDAKENNRVFYNEVFAAFEGVLNVLCGIDNYNYLHGVLALRYPEAYDFGRDYLLKNGNANLQADSIADRIYSFICEKGRPISKAELFQAFKGFSNVMLTMPFANDSRLMQWDYNYYTCSGLQDISSDDVADLKGMLLEIFAENKGYASDGLLFDKVTERRKDFLQKNMIQSEMNLHYIVASMFADEMDFKRPHICEKERLDISATKNVALYLLGNPDYFSFEQYSEMADKMRWSRVTSGVVLSDIEEDYARISLDGYYKKTAFEAPNEIVDCVKAFFDENMEDGILPLMSVDFDDFIDWEYGWNEFIIETIIRNYIPSIEVIHPTMKDRRYQRGIVVSKEKALKSYSQIVATKMLSLGCDSMTESQFLSFLIVQNLARKAIPSELTDSEFIRKDGDYYRVVVE